MNIKALVRDKTPEELFKYAQSWYGIEEEKARKILKDAGHEMFKRDNYFVYLNILREHWDHIQEIREKCPVEDRGQKKKRLQRESQEVKMVFTPNGWKYEGSEEALKSYWELQDLLREENVRRCLLRRI